MRRISCGGARIQIWRRCLAVKTVRAWGRGPTPLRGRLSDFSIAEQTAIAKQFDTSSLVEVTRISDLPSDLKQHFKGWLGRRRENIATPSEDDPGDLPGGFIIAGISDSSALVAHEEHGYVPTTHATVLCTCEGRLNRREEVERHRVSENAQRVGGGSRAICDASNRTLTTGSLGSWCAGECPSHRRLVQMRLKRALSGES
jgi:hypothetical protein